MNNRKWTEKETDYLAEKWGYNTVPQIAFALSRTNDAVILKAKKLKLGSPTIAGEYLTANKVAELLKVDIHTVTDYWIKKCGLKAVSRALSGTRIMKLITMENLTDWLKNNTDKWDSRKLELYALGQEPDWLKSKRTRDKKLAVRRYVKWTAIEDQSAIVLFKRGFTIKQIAGRIGRTSSSVEHRLSRIDIWGTGKYKYERVSG